MDDVADDIEVLSSERSSETTRVLIQHGPWRVRELPLDKDKIDYIWGEVQKSPTLFSDLTVKHAHAFLELLENPYTYWLEVLDEPDKTIAIVYVTEMFQIVDANIHLLFFDRDLSDKGELVKEIIELIFKKFPGLHRLTASIPDIFFATKRLALKSGLKLEGSRREALLIGGKWHNETIYGILAKESLNGTK